MIRHELARILRALADRLEVEKPPAEARTEIQYVYVHNTPPLRTTLPWQSPYYYGNTSAGVYS